MMRLLRVCAGVVAVAFAGYFVLIAAQSFDRDVLLDAFGSSDALLATVAAAFLYALIFPLTGWAWSRLLAVRGRTWHPVDLTRIVALSQIAKYVPGNVAQHVARAGLAIKQGINAGDLAATVIQETFLTMTASLVVGLAALLLSGHGLMESGGSHGQVILLALATLIAMPLCLPLSRLVVRRLRGRLGRLAEAILAVPGWRVSLVVLLVYSLNYLLIGVGLWLVALVVGHGDGLTFAKVTAAFALSWLLGFVTPGAPAGLGTREGIMLLLLQGAAEPSELLGFVLLARLATMAGDVMAFLAAMLGQVLHKAAGEAND
jgi:hypothetical protein